MRSKTIAELCCWLVAGWALLSQIGCFRGEEVIAGEDTLHMKDATFTPDFALKRGDIQVSLPATVRYWTAPGQSFTVTWPEIRVQSACNFCNLAMCTGDVGIPSNPPEVVVFHRLPAEPAIVEDPPRFYFTSGCPGAREGPAVFTPVVTAEYLAHIVFSTVAPIPSEPGMTWFPIHVLSSSFAMPPRLLTPVMGTAGATWTWQARRDAGGLKEAFDPRLHVGRVRILLGTCVATPATPRDDECGEDKLMDNSFVMEGVVAPHYVRVGNVAATLQECRGQATPNGDGDGDIDFGVDPSNPTRSRCRPQPDLVSLTPAYSSLETQAGTPIIWTVEFSKDDGFEPPDETRQVWIEFTLVPSP